MGSWTVNIRLKSLRLIRLETRPGTLQIPFIYDNLAPLVTLGSEEDLSLSHSIKIPFTTPNRFRRLSRRLMMLAVLVSICDREHSCCFWHERCPVEDSTHFQGALFWRTDRGQLTYVLETPLTSRDGSQDGRYVLNVQATDTLGNTKTYKYQFVYDTQLPTLVSTVPAANETISELSQVEVVLDEATSGIDFIQSTFRLTRGVDGNAVDVPVNITSNGSRCSDFDARETDCLRRF